MIPWLCLATGIPSTPHKCAAQGEELAARCGLTTKLPMAADALGTPLNVIRPAGPCADMGCAAALVENPPAQAAAALRT